MPLYIRDDEVDRLAAVVQKLTGAATKTEAVKAALKHEIENVRNRVPLSKRLEAAKEIARSIGPRDPAFDMKSFTDEMWGDV